MAKILAKLKQLRNADVRYISLVDRAATRIPFRVLKRDKENMMGIDLTKVFKSENTEKPYVSALVVFAQKDETAAAQVMEAIKTHGFTTDRVQKSDEGETLVFAQADEPKDMQTIRLSDQLLVNVANLKVPTGWVGEMVKEQGFFPDLKSATAALHDQLQDIVAKSETPQPDAEAALISYASYLNQMAILPTNCFKLDEAITDIVKKCGENPNTEVTTESESEAKEQKEVEAVVEKGAGKTKEDAAKATKTETEAERMKRVKSHPPSEMAPKDEEDDQKPPPDAVEKKDSGAIIAALKSIEAKVTGLATKLETVVTEQTAQKKVLDDVVQKSDTLASTLKTTVTAMPESEDRPSGSSRVRIQKDDDPRTGNFDTAFLRKRR